VLTTSWKEFSHLASLILFQWNKKTSSDNAETTDEDDIDSALQKEVDHLKAEKVKDPSQRRFQVVESGANNCLFIRTTVSVPLNLLMLIMENICTSCKNYCLFLD